MPVEDEWIKIYTLYAKGMTGSCSNLFAWRTYPPNMHMYLMVDELANWVFLCPEGARFPIF